jgi:hypothetical protein
VKKAQITTRVIEKSGFPESGTLVGRIMEMDENGQVWVDFSGNSFGPLAARTTSTVQEKLQKGNPRGREVLLAFNQNDPQCPIIIDTMFNMIEEIAENSISAVLPDEIQEEKINSKRIVLDAQDEMVLQSGKSSITLTKAGKVLIKGEYVLSKSRRANKIKGGSIRLN